MKLRLTIEVFTYRVPKRLAGFQVEGESGFRVISGGAFGRAVAIIVDRKRSA